MTTFLQTVESAAELAPGYDGKPVRGIRAHPKYQLLAGEALTLIERVSAGDRRAMLDFQEAMSTADFPLLFADILERELLGHYVSYGNSWASYMARRVVNDFRNVKSFTLDGANSALTEAIAEGGEYPEASLTESKYEWGVKKYGRKLSLTWETFVNGDMDQFNMLPEQLALAARRGEERYAAELLTDASGPDATFFTGVSALAGNPALTAAALGTALDQVAQHTDAQGEPIVIAPSVLLVPPALKLTADAILEATQYESTERGGTSGQKMISGNVLASQFTVAVNPYLGTVPSSNGATSWYLLPSPTGGGRPAAQMGFLRGHEEPQLFRKASNATSAGGGLADALEGDYDTDAVGMKVRHVFGGSLIAATGAIASDGSGS